MDYKFINIRALLLMVATLIVGCSGRDSAVGDKIADRIVECELSEKESVNQIKSVFKSATILPLEENENSIVSSECEVLELNGDYFLVNKQLRNCIRFDKDGKYKNQVGQSGRAGNEFLDISSVQIEGDELLIYSNAKSNIFRYSVDGELLEIIETGVLAQQLLKVGDEYYAYFGYDNGQQKERVLVYDSSFNVKRRYLPSEAKLILFSEFVEPMMLSNGEIYVRETYNKYLHKIQSNGEVLTPLGFDFGSYNLPSEMFSQNDAFKAAELMMASDFATIYRFEKSSDYWFVQANFQIKDDKVYGVLGLGVESGDYSWITATSTGANALLFSTVRSVSDAGEVMALVDRSVVEDFNSSSAGFIENAELLELVEGDNPIIVKFKIR